MTTDRAAVDTTVLVYAHFPDSPHYAASVALLEQARVPTAGLCLFPQMLTEFFAVATNPKRVTVPMSAVTAVAAIDHLLAFPGLALLPLPADVAARWTALVRARPVIGRHVYDYQIAAAMLAYGIGTVYTHNTRDFAPIPGITAVAPPEPTAGRANGPV
ncbi:MAG: PIN domain-containing protein [Gemmataceae bacterium]